MVDISLRPYQKKQAWGIHNALKEKNSVLVQSPTGTGKNYLMSAMFQTVDARGGKMLFLVKGRNVVSQFAESLEAIGIDYTFMMAQRHYSSSHEAIVASMDTLHSWYFKEDARYNKSGLLVPDYVLVDECRKITTPNNMMILDWFREKGSKIVGFDATPKHNNLHLIYDDMIHGEFTPWHISNGDLVPVTHYAPAMNDAKFIEALKDLRKRSHGDYSEKDLEALAASSNALVGAPVENYERICLAEFGEYRPFVIACVSRAHARSVQTAFMESGHEVEYIDGNTPNAERLEMFQRVREGKTVGIISVLVMIYGVDLPCLQVCILARPTQDVRLLLQIGGRVLRPSAGKDRAIFIDHTRALQDIGYIDDEYTWSLDPNEVSGENLTRKKKAAETNKENVDITCRACGHMYSNSAKCPKCGEVNIIKIDADNIIYYNKDLERKFRDEQARISFEQEQATFISELKTLVCNQKENYFQQLNAMNTVLGLKYNQQLTPELFNKIQAAEGVSRKTQNYVTSTRIRLKHRKY